MIASFGNARVVRWFERIPIIAGTLVVFVGGLTLVNWQIQFVATNSAVRPLLMLPWTCVFFVCSGSALLLSSRPDSPRWMRLIALAFTIFVLVGAMAQATEWAFRENFGIDTLFFPDLILGSPLHPAGRPSGNTVTAFMAAAASLIAIHLDDRDDGTTAQWFAYIALVVAFVGFVGYVFGVSELYILPPRSRMSLPSTICMTILAVGLICARHTHGLPHLLVDDGAAGSVSRRLVPAAILVPFLLGVIRIYGQETHLFSTTFGNSAYLVANITLFVWLVTRSAWMAYHSDREREAFLAREQAAREAAETANVAKSNFLAVMSHELRTPLSAILGYEELLVDEIAGPVSDAQRHQLGRIKVSAQHLLRMIDQILDYSRVDASQELIREENVAANALADQAVALAEPLAHERGLHLTVTHVHPEVEMHVDTAKVRQVLVNLLSNAVKFTLTGDISLRVYQPDSSTIHYVVSDTGIGIAPEHLDTIFDAFWQVERPNTRRTGGAGLGLSVTRRIVQLLGGHIVVQSTLGEGSVFTVSLPVHA